MEVAKLCGIKVRAMFYSVYAFAGLLYGIAGIMLAARVQVRFRPAARDTK